MRCSLLCTLAAALIPQHRVMQQRHRVMRMAVESAEFTLKGETVATAFFANQCRREMTQFRGLAGSIAPGSEPTWRGQRSISVEWHPMGVQPARHLFPATRRL